MLLVYRKVRDQIKERFYKLYERFKQNANNADLADSRR
jgi:hypothetical protein